jgi:hypothetical protein
VANHLVISAPASGTAGTSFSFTVTAMDVSNKVVTTYTGPVSFASSDVQATLPAASSLMNGTGTFSATLRAAGGETITAIDTGNPLLMGASTISVSAGAATHLSLSGQNSALVGAPYSVAVDALDAFANVAASYNGTIHFTSSDPQAVLPGNSTLTNGSGTFNVTLKTTASETITATDTVTSSITGTSSSIIVSTTGPPVISTSPAPPVGAENLAYDFTFTLASGGQAPFTWSETGALPPGLTFNNSTGELSGTPAITTTPSFPIVLQVRDSLGQESVPQDFTIQIALHGFSATGSMGTARSEHTATVLSSGKVLVVGGAGLASSEMFDPASGAFTTGNNMGTSRARHTATLLKSGKVLIAGGWMLINNQTTQALASAELFDPTTGMFTATKGDMTDARAHDTATLLDDGKVLLTGGVGNSGVFFMTAELFDPTTETFSLTGKMEVARAGHTATLLNNGKVLVAGGGNGSGDFATAEIFDPSTGSFAPTAGNMVTARGGHTATMLNDGTVLLAGGSSDASAELFDPNTATFMPTAGNMETLRENHTATLLDDGTVLIAGGDLCCRTVDGKPVPISITTAELYTPASKTFSPTGSLQNSRFFHTASLLNDGTVLVSGGVSQMTRNGVVASRVLSTAELYH